MMKLMCLSKDFPGLIRQVPLYLAFVQVKHVAFNLETVQTRINSLNPGPGLQTHVSKSMLVDMDFLTWFLIDRPMACCHPCCSQVPYLKICGT